MASFLIQNFLVFLRWWNRIRDRSAPDSENKFLVEIPRGLKYLMRGLLKAVIVECQQTVSHLSICSFYSAGQVSGTVNFPPYKKYEALYWGMIPFWIATYSSKRSIRHCLDVGCGYGTLALFTRKLNPECRIDLVDFTDVYISPTLVSQQGFQFTRANIELDPLPYDTRYDVILFTEILEHFNFNPLPTLHKLYTVLIDQGILLISTPNADVWGHLDYYPHWNALPEPNPTAPIVDRHIYQYTQQEIIDLLEQAGFQIERLEYSGAIKSAQFNIICRKKISLSNSVVAQTSEQMQHD